MTTKSTEVQAAPFLIEFLRWLNANPHHLNSLNRLRSDLEMGEIGSLDLVDELVRRTRLKGSE